MLTKGIDYYTFLDTEDCRVTFCASNLTPVSYCASFPMCKGNFQIPGGKFAWKAENADGILYTGFAEINPLVGNLSRSNLNNMMSTKSIITPKYSLSYGFYDCGMRTAANFLTNQEKSYVYLTHNYSEWMKDLARKNPQFLDRPLNVLALAGAHDAGMFETFNFKSLLKNEDFSNKFQLHIADSLAYSSTNFSDVSNYLERIVINLACTQKDDISTMLDLGIRYFDFRPGYCYEPFRDLSGIQHKIFHQHAFIPGYLFYDFLCDIFKWLAAHPEEIVVVNLNFQGFEEASMKPNIEDLVKLVQNAQLDTNTRNIAIGGKENLNETIRLLLNESKRLIFLNQIDVDSDALKYDSYNDEIYATIDVNDILTALDRMQWCQPKDDTYTVLQLQGTASADIKACSTSILDAMSLGSSDAMSLLMSNKAAFDNSTYPWLWSNVSNEFSPNSLLVFLNDFVDNALVKHAIDITCKRIYLWPNNT
jgi:hypothetical protein